MPKRKKKYLKDEDVGPYRRRNTPTVCPILGTTEFKPVLDHCHDSGKVRGVLSNEANILLGKFENYLQRCGSPLAKEIVAQRMADYMMSTRRLRGDLPFHPQGLRQVVKRFKSKPVSEQKRILTLAGYPQEEIREAKNATKRANLYRKLLKEE